MLDRDTQDIATQQLQRFAVNVAGMAILSTGAQVVSYAGDLYNVVGSTPDPRIDGLTWKGLLQGHGISGNCYADTPPAPTPASHPGFSVGGHVTPNADGSVPIGGRCYLMPLCYWHNGKANDGKAFSHARTQLLQLSGYMQDEPAATFLARMTGDAPLALVFLGENGLSYRNIADAPDAKARTFAAIDRRARADDGPFLLLRRHTDGDAVTYTIDDGRL